ncbi:zinc-binding alcohol dehydrogenase family protein [Enterobacter sp. RHBSTW-00994]|uniref:quinone oxidoreductase family protein n=1 Tax=Enterobacter sp. RHBSTW-00994 TaxID=2742676 RepID=UPI0015E8EF03|nr:zinc-binding alcohol dehydrogenase family protein [Enterobacter sp. RHBSTW-00994]QLR43445.1 zinc-binding alcohol dehydrogenase family protein [Enterobacter sp. RHBSTW-00994]
MKAAIVFDLNQGPVYTETASPTPQPGQHIVHVQASAISHVVKSRASGKHYSFDGALPFITGIDGTGITADGQRVYFAFPPSPWGSMAEYVPVAIEHCVPLPENLDAATAAAMANPGMSAWAALVKRAQLQAGETVLVNGATGSAGQLAVQIARYLGAGKVIVTGRNLQVLAQLQADESVLLNDDATSITQQLSRLAANGIDVVVDYLWGNSASALLAALAKHTPGVSPVRFVQVGALSEGEITLPGAVLRSSPIQLMGSGIGSLSMADLLQATAEMLQAAVPGGFTIATTPARLEDVADAWARDDSRQRTVFVMP